MKELLVSDNVMSSLEPLFSTAAKAIRRAVAESRPVILRYNNDADGICAGLAIYRALMKLLAERGVTVEGAHRFFRDIQNNSAIYGLGDAMGDILIVRGMSELAPLVVLVDFGANIESMDGLKAAKEEKAEIVVIDHHPPFADALGLIDVFVSPWAVSGGTSQYCAGLIAGEVAKEMAGVEVSGLQRVAMAGDRSVLQPPSDELRKKALALDYLADTVRPRNTLEKCEEVLADPKRVAEAWGEATRKLAEAASEAKQNAKTRELENGFVVVISDMSKRLKIGLFPPKGKVVGALHDELSATEKRPLVTIGKGLDSVTFRANAAAKAAGFNASRIIDELKAEWPNAIQSGGGHDVAASVRMNKGFAKLLLEEAVKKISEIKK